MAVPEELEEGEADGDSESLPLLLAEGESLPVLLALAPPVMEAVGLPVPLALSVLEGDTEAVSVVVGVGLGLLEAEGLLLEESETRALTEPVLVGVGVREGGAVRLALPERRSVAEPEGLTVGRRVGTAMDALALREPVNEARGFALAVAQRALRAPASRPAQTARRSGGERCGDGAAHLGAFRRRPGVEALHDLAVLADHELGEVPADGGTAGLGREPLVERVRARALDVDLLRHRKRDVIFC